MLKKIVKLCLFLFLFFQFENVFAGGMFSENGYKLVQGFSKMKDRIRRYNQFEYTFTETTGFRCIPETVKGIIVNTSDIGKNDGEKAASFFLSMGAEILDAMLMPALCTAIIKSTIKAGQKSNSAIAGIAAGATVAMVLNILNSILGELIYEFLGGNDYAVELSNPFCLPISAAMIVSCVGYTTANLLYGAFDKFTLLFWFYATEVYLIIKLLYGSLQEALAVAAFQKLSMCGDEWYTYGNSDLIDAESINLLNTDAREAYKGNGIKFDLRESFFDHYPMQTTALFGSYKFAVDNCINKGFDAACQFLKNHVSNTELNLVIDAKKNFTINDKIFREQKYNGIEFIFLNTNHNSDLDFDNCYDPRPEVAKYDIYKNQPNIKKRRQAYYAAGMEGTKFACERWADKIEYEDAYRCCVEASQRFICVNYKDKGFYDNQYVVDINPFDKKFKNFYQLCDVDKKLCEVKGKVGEKVINKEGYHRYFVNKLMEYTPAGICSISSLSFNSDYSDPWKVESLGHPENIKKNDRKPLNAIEFFTTFNQPIYSRINLMSHSSVWATQKREISIAKTVHAKGFNNIQIKKLVGADFINEINTLEVCENVFGTWTPNNQGGGTCLHWSKNNDRWFKCTEANKDLNIKGGDSVDVKQGKELCKDYKDAGNDMEKIEKIKFKDMVNYCTKNFPINDFDSLVSTDKKKQKEHPCFCYSNYIEEVKLSISNPGFNKIENINTQISQVKEDIRILENSIAQSKEELFQSDFSIDISNIQANIEENENKKLVAETITIPFLEKQLESVKNSLTPESLKTANNKTLENKRNELKNINETINQIQNSINKINEPITKLEEEITKLSDADKVDEDAIKAKQDELRVKKDEINNNATLKEKEKELKQKTIVKEALEDQVNSLNTSLEESIEEIGENYMPIYKTVIENDIGENKYLCVDMFSTCSERSNFEEYLKKLYGTKDKTSNSGLILEVKQSQTEGVNKYCVNTYNFCPYNFNIMGGTEKFGNQFSSILTYKNGKVSVNNTSTSSESISQADVPDGPKPLAGQAMECKQVYQINGKNVDVLRDCYEKNTNYCQIDRHCARMNRYDPITYENNTVYLDKACFNFVGDSKLDTNYKTYTAYKKKTQYPTEHLILPFAQCLIETSKNFILNVAGHTRCNNASEMPNEKDRCLVSGNFYTAGEDLFINTSFINPFTRLRKSLKQVILVAMTLSFMAYGLKIVLLRHELKQSEIMMYIIKLTVVTSFAYGGWWIQPVLRGVYSVTNNMIVYILDIMMVDAASGSTTKQDASFYENSYFDGCYFSSDIRITDVSAYPNALETDIFYTPYPKNKEYLAFFDFIDCKLRKYIGFVNGSSSAILILGVIVFFSGGIALIAFLPLIFIFGSLILTTIKVAYIMILTFLMISLLLAMAPIMIPLVLFDKTKGIYDKWLKQVIGFMFYPMFIVVATTFIFLFFDKFIAGKAQFTGINNAPFRTLFCGNICIYSIGDKESILLLNENKSFDAIKNSCVEDLKGKFESISTNSLLCIINSKNKTKSYSPSLLSMFVKNISFQIFDSKFIALTWKSLFSNGIILFLILLFLDQILTSIVKMGSTIFEVDLNADEIPGIKDLMGKIVGFIGSKFLNNPIASLADVGWNQFLQACKGGGKGKKDEKANRDSGGQNNNKSGSGSGEGAEKDVPKPNSKPGNGEGVEK